MSNIAASMFGFFSTRIAIDSVFGTLLVTPIGTTAPFSAMSGVEKNVMSLLCAGRRAAQRLDRVVQRLASRTRALFQFCAASASPGAQPARRGEQRQQRRRRRLCLQHILCVCVFIVSPPSEKPRCYC